MSSCRPIFSRRTADRDFDRATARDRAARNARARSFAAAAGRALGLGALLWLASCSAVAPLLPSSQAARLTSFLGVRFGATLAEVQRVFPGGIPETSPYGADAFRIANVNAGAATYKSVIYEFVEGQGMQLALARFDALSAKAVLDELQQSLGQPTRTDSRPGAPAEQALWRAPAGVSVRYDGGEGLLVIVGPHGASLEPDIKLRAQASGGA